MMFDRYPLSIDNRRNFPSDFTGLVFVWDIDKTYLDTHFSTFKGLLRIPLEFGIDKKAIDGMADILISLRRGAGSSPACHPLYFVSASPAQLKPIIERKMLFDGVEFDGFCFKNWLKVIASGRLYQLKNQVGFKICALLSGRIERPHSREVIFGDNVEQDPQAFSLYSHLINEPYHAARVEEILQEAQIPTFDRTCIHNLLEKLEGQKGAVERIFIHMADKKVSQAEVCFFSELIVPVWDAASLRGKLREFGYIL